MSKLWTKHEESILRDAMGGRLVMDSLKLCEVKKLLPGRTLSAVRSHWGKIRQPKQIPLPMYNPTFNWMDALTKPAKVQETTISQIKALMRQVGLRGRVTIELGD